MMAKSSFSVIVVGGGPVGLTAAHALSKAGIDFTILERRETIIEDIGATIFLWPQGMRIMSQLGVLESLREVAMESQLGTQQEHDGSMFGTINSPEWCHEHFHVWPLTMARADIVKILYNSLPENARSKIHVNKKVASTTSLPASEDDGKRTRVTCADGSTYDGTIVIGADGVHSVVRKSMAGVGPEFPFQAKYRILWFHYPRAPDTAATIVYEVHGKGLMLQILSTETSSFALLYKRLDKPHRGYVRYTSEDMEALVAEAGFLPVGKKGRALRDVWATKTKAGMANLEEGYLKKVYSGGKTVLVGDAAHKVTPHSGLGLNEGVSDVVSLVNELGKAVACSGGAVPGERELELAFERHQKTRMPVIKKGNLISWLSVRQGTFRNKAFWLMGRVILKMPGVDRLVFRKVVIPLIQQGVVLDCVEQEEPFLGKTAWKNPMRNGKGDAKA
ncbi:hypothetical protein QBC35DRAFT_467784 [Podospora australis]|uniref:FAD-binding domain-containing protein n=1 Tax=Podospora australis TaxID=1536484 RepID=A0AAN7ADS0_9PEZI|nr:hypothetical protein QBC35DRAFT_467784 [Podospora australis]